MTAASPQADPPPPAAAAAARHRAGRRARAHGEGRAGQRRRPRRAGERVLRLPAFRPRDPVVRSGLQDRSEERQRQHRSRDLLLLHERSRSRAGADRPIARGRSAAREEPAQPGRHRASARTICKGAAESWEKVVAIAPDSDEGRMARQGLDGLKSGHTGRTRRRRPAVSVILVWILRAVVVLFLIRLVLRALGIWQTTAAPPRQAPRPREVERSGGTLVQDPQCGTYLPKSRALVARRQRRHEVLLLDRRAATPRLRPSARQAGVDVIDDRSASRRHRRGRPPPLDARLRRLERRQHHRPHRSRSAADDARQRLEGLHDAGHDGRDRSRRRAHLRRARPQAVVRDHDAPGGLSAAAGRRRRGARAPAARDRLRRRRHRARPRRARRGRDDAGQHSDRASTARRRRGSWRTRSRRSSRAHDGLLLANHGALALGSDLFGAYYKMETIEHFAQISLVARMLGREHLLSREEVMRLQDLRGRTASHRRRRSVPIRTRSAGDPSCQVISGAGLAGRASGARHARRPIGVAVFR